MDALQRTRLLIPDTGDAPMFSDEELLFLLAENGDDPRLAAADALEIIAGDPQRVQQFSRGGVSVTKSTAEDLRKRAIQLREQATGGIVVGTIERNDFWG